MDRIDEIDRRILYYLTEDARNTSARAIADDVDVSDRTIHNRIQQLEEDGIIQGYSAQINYEQAEGRLMNLFICTAPVPERERLVKQALELPAVVDARELMAGRRNVHIVGVGTDTEDITQLASYLSDLGLEIESEDLIQQQYTSPYQPFGPENGNRSSLTDFVSLTGGAEVIELTVSETAEGVDKTLAEADDQGLLEEGVLVVGIERGDEIITPSGETRIKAGDVITLFARGDISKDTITSLSGGDSADRSKSHGG